MNGLSRANESTSQLAAGRLLSTLLAALLVFTGMIGIPAYADEAVPGDAGTSEEAPAGSGAGDEPGGSEDPSEGEEPGGGEDLDESTDPDTGDEPNLVITGSIPTIDGIAAVGSTLTALPGIWKPEGVTLAYQWLRNGISISGATSETYTLSAYDAGSTISVVVTGNLADSEPVTHTSAAVGPITTLTLTTSVPTITGRARVGETLLAHAGTWTEGATLSYEWSRDNVAIPGATTSSYELTGTDAGKSITVTVIGELAGYVAGSETSEPTSAVEYGTLLSTIPTINGAVKVGSTLTATVGTWTPKPTLKYQWLRNGKVIDGATKTSYMLVAADKGKVITFQVSGKLAGYTDKSVKSAATAKVATGSLAKATPTVSGTLAVGSTLTAKPGTWTKSTSFTYQWLRGGKSISGATKSTYKLVAADEGKQISVKVTGKKSGYTPVSATSGKTSKIWTASAPKITGTKTVGQTLTAKPGTWSPKPTFTYQWLRDGKAISGATKSTYKLVAADAGKQISVKATGNRSGYSVLAKTSGKTAKIAKATLKTATPTITGTKTFGKTLTAKPGTWTSGTKLTYQWLRNGTAISGETSKTYKLKNADTGKQISVKVTGTKSGYKTVSKTSAKTSKIAKATLKTATPTISGTAKVGKTLTAKPGTWTSGAALKYQWYRNGAAISKATSSSYKLVAADAGKQITVKVTGTKIGYNNASKTSTKTAKTALGTLSSATPKITGSKETGKTLKVTVGTWTSGTAFKYQWYRNGTAISKATKSTYKLVSADAGKQITIKVTGTKSGYTTASKISSKTSKVLAVVTSPVKAGAFCKRIDAGKVGYTSAGTKMRCTYAGAETTPRWRAY